ncbi:MAG TPA: S9 family peptidase [Ktedonobacteraceae bacterium]|nr:S9 family peptidase [Ktedonobacteraceae bacterium]
MTRSITIEDLYQLKFLNQPCIAPDGQQVAFVVTRIEESKHEYRSAIWLAATNGQSVKQFTSESTVLSSLAWSPDGRWLAFVSNRNNDLPAGKDQQEQKKRGKGKPQIWLLPADGGEAHQLTFMEHGASAPVWSPDSRKLLFSAAVGPADPENEEGESLPKVRVIDRLWYRLDGVGFIYERRSHLFCVDAAGGTPVQLTDGDWDDRDAAWSSDGSQIAFVSNREDDRWRIPGADVYTLPFVDGKAGDLRRLTDGTLDCGSPSWSPDGQTIAFMASAKVHSSGQVYLYTIAASAENAAPTCLSKDFEGSFMDWLNSDLGDEHLMPAPVWSADERSLYVIASQRGASRVYSVPVQGSGTEPPVVTPGNIHLRDFSADAARKTFALLLTDATHPAEIFVCSPEEQGSLRRITGLNETFLQTVYLAEPEYMPYVGHDEWPIDGWILKPQNFDPAHKYPLVVEIHGGPHTQYGYGFFHEMQMLVAEGYVVLYTNPRGSCGYGYEFADAVRGAWGEKDSFDILHGVDTLLKRGYIDEQRLAVTGGSYGGFMTNWLIGHDNRFKVAITDRCVSNIASMFGASDVGWDLGYENFDAMPWENLEAYMHMSPISYVQNMRTPLLIIHSEQDLRCGIEQAEQLFTALKWMGREVQFVRFEGQSHGLSRGGHPHSRLERLRHIKSWFAKYLQ